MEKPFTVLEDNNSAGSEKTGSFFTLALRWSGQRIYEFTLYAYAFLYMFTGYSKLGDVDRFIKGNKKIPLMGRYAELIGWGIPLLEILLAILLLFPFVKIQRAAIWVSTALMGLFTIYLILMLLFVKDRLCHCGGVIEEMGWTMHIAFNLTWMIAGVLALKGNRIINT